MVSETVQEFDDMTMVCPHCGENAIPSPEHIIRGDISEDDYWDLITGVKKLFWCRKCSRFLLWLHGFLIEFP